MLLENNRMSTPPTLRDLQKEYKQKIAEYDSEVANALATDDRYALPGIRKRNEEIAKLLEQMLVAVAGDPQAMRGEREELVRTLNRIESDYAGLAKSTDALQRLRMMRTTDAGVARKEFNWYLFLFILACTGILFMALFAGQNMLATTTRPAMPASTAPLV
jgi:hypothetical protein